MKFLPSANPAFLQAVIEESTSWRFPTYARAFLHHVDSLHNTDGFTHQPVPPPITHLAASSLLPLLSAAFVEWRYYSIIAPAFHGIVGLAMVNPFNRFSRIAESGLLLIVAGIFDAPRQAAPLREAAAHHELRQLCWMHLFPTTSLHFTGADMSDLQAEHAGIHVQVDQLSPQEAHLEVHSEAGLSLSMQHSGLPRTAIAPHFADDLRRVPGAHWIVYNPSPIASTSGELQCSAPFLQQIARQQESTPTNSVSAQLLHDAAADYHARWQNADGYYEHSFGINPLPLHGWDFLFVPDAARGQGLVLQTYVYSQSLRYIEVFWRADGAQRYTRFTAEQMRLTWQDSAVDPAIGVRLPGKRLISAHQPGLHLEVENDIPHQIPFLRPEKLAVRHFFISEQMGMCSWRLTDDTGRSLAEVYEQPAGGELAHVRSGV